MEHWAEVGGYVAYYLLPSHIVALTDGPAYDGIQGWNHRTAVLAGKGKNRRQWQVDVDDVCRVVLMLNSFSGRWKMSCS